MTGQEHVLSHEIPIPFFERDPREVAPELLGSVIASSRNGLSTGGRIVEVEAYLGSDDPGSHAATKGITARNAVMYGPPGHLYVYFTYGNHHMLNIVCEADGVAGAVLIRALEPLFGIEVMSERRGGRPLRELANGPGKLAAALGLDLTDNGSRLGRGSITIHAAADGGESVGVSGRVGLSSGHELQLRYYFEDNAFVSKGRIGPPTDGTRRARGRATGGTT